jgi:hypothetical protein
VACQGCAAESSEVIWVVISLALRVSFFPRYLERGILSPLSLHEGETDFLAIMFLALLIHIPYKGF